MSKNNDGQNESFQFNVVEIDASRLSKINHFYQGKFFKILGKFIKNGLIIINYISIFYEIDLTFS